jgi:hypothetical protein
MPSITSLREVFGRQYSDEPTAGRAVRIFRATMDGATYFLTDILDDPTLPPLGEVYSWTHPELRVVGREIAEVGRSLIEFEITIRYDRFPYNDWDVKTSSQTVDMVLDATAEATVGVGMPARFVASPAKYLATQPVGAKGETPANRAKDGFDPPIMVPRTQTVITAEIMVDAMSDLGFATVGDLNKLVGKVNSERIQIFSIPDESDMGCDYWTLLLEDAGVTKIKTPAGCSYLVSLRIIYDPLGHCAVVLNSGYNELVEPGTANEKKRKCRGADQMEVSAPVPLDANGQAIDPKTLPAAGTYVICPNRETFAWSVLGLPKTFCTPAPTPAP